jgi:hypothetical protein
LCKWIFLYQKLLFFEKSRISIEVINTSGGTGVSTSSGHVGHTTGHATGGTTSSLVDSHNDGLELSFDFLLFGLVFLSGGFGVGFKELEGISGGSLNGGLVIRGELILEFLVLELVLDLESVSLESVLGFNSLLELFILILVAFGFHDESVDFLLGESSLIVGDGDLLVLAGSFVHGRDVEDTIGIDIESDFDLGGSARCWGDTFEVEFSEEVVVLGHGSFSFEDLDEDTGLVVSVGGEGLGLLGGDGSVSGDQSSHDTTSGLDTLGKGGNIEHTDTFDLLVLDTIEDGGLNSGSVSDSFIGVDGSVEGLSVEEVGDELLNLGDSGGSTDHDEIVDLTLGESSVGESVLDGLHALSEEVDAEFFELGTSHLESEIFTFSEGFALNHGGDSGGEGSLGLFALSSKSSEGSVVSLDIDTGLLLEFGHAEIDESVVEIFSTQMGVSVGGLNFEDTILNGEDRDIEGTTTEIEDEDIAFSGSVFVETVGNSGGGGLVDDSLDVELGDGSSILGGLSLGIVEIGGDGDDGVVNLFTEVGFGDILHLGKNHGGDFFSLELLFFTLELDNDHGLVGDTSLDLEGPESAIFLDKFVLELTSDESLGIEDGVGRVSGDLGLGGISDETLIFSEGDVRGGGVKTLIVSDDLNFLVHPDTNARVGGSEVNSNAAGHIMECYLGFLLN